MVDIQSINLQNSISEFKQTEKLGAWWKAVGIYFALSYAIVPQFLVKLGNQSSGSLSNWGINVFAIFDSSTFMNLLEALLIAWAIRVMLIYYRTHHHASIWQELKDRPLFRDFLANFLATFLFTIISLLFILPFAIFVGISMTSYSVALGIIISIIAVIAYFITIIYFLYARIALVPYILAYDKEGIYSATEIITLSMKIGKNYPFEIFKVSIISGIVITLSTAFFAIPLIWTVPYVTYYNVRLMTAILDENDIQFA